MAAIGSSATLFDHRYYNRPIHLFNATNLITPSASTLALGTRIRPTNLLRAHRRPTPILATMLLPDNPVVSDVCATAITGCVALSSLRLWQETAKRGIFDQKLNRKLVHISIGLVFMLCWPLFSSGYPGAVLAALIPGVNIIKMLLLGLGILKDEATVKSMSRFGDYSLFHALGNFSRGHYTMLQQLLLLV